MKSFSSIPMESRKQFSIVLWARVFACISVSRIKPLASRKGAAEFWLNSHTQTSKVSGANEINASLKRWYGCPIWASRRFRNLGNGLAIISGNILKSAANIWRCHAIPDFIRFTPPTYPGEKALLTLDWSPEYKIFDTSQSLSPWARFKTLQVLSYVDNTSTASDATDDLSNKY